MRMKVCNNYRCALIHIDALLNALMYLCIYAFFHFNRNLSAESDLNSSLKLGKRKWQEKRFLVSKVESFLDFQLNKNLTC